MNKLLWILLLVFVYSNSFSQEKINDNFRVGIALGMSQSGNDTHSWGKDGEGILNKTNVVIGLSVEYKFDKKFSIRGNWFNSKIEGNDEDVLGHEWRKFSFNSPLNEISAELKWYFWNRKFDDSNTEYKFSQISPLKRMSAYLTLGGALTLTDPTINLNASASDADKSRDENNTSNAHFQIPASVGFNFYLTQNLNLDIEGRGVFATTDFLDGMSAVVNEENNDAYFFGLVRLNFDF